MIENDAVDTVETVIGEQSIVVNATLSDEYEGIRQESVKNVESLEQRQQHSNWVRISPRIQKLSEKSAFVADTSSSPKKPTRKRPNKPKAKLVRRQRKECDLIDDQSEDIDSPSSDISFSSDDEGFVEPELTADLVEKYQSGKLRQSSSRDAYYEGFDKPIFLHLRELIESNAEEVVVLKLKDFITMHASPGVLDSIIISLEEKNANCQALYIQNFVNFNATHLEKLARTLKANKTIWALNIGEINGLNNGQWTRFAEELRDTNVTHIYASEHLISVEVKTLLRDVIRINREKHTRHCSMENIDVIKRVTNMWWNPINARCLREAIADNK